MRVFAVPFQVLILKLIQKIKIKINPTGIWKVMGSTPVGGSENSFSEYFDLRTFLHYLHFI